MGSGGFSPEEQSRWKICRTRGRQKKETHNKARGAFEGNSVF